MLHAVLVDLKQQHAHEYTFITAVGYTVICQQTNKQLNCSPIKDLFSNIFILCF